MADTEDLALKVAKLETKQEITDKTMDKLDQAVHSNLEATLSIKSRLDKWNRYNTPSLR